MAFFLWPVPEEIRHPEPAGSQLLVDRHGLPLREVLGPGHVSARVVRLEEVSPHLVQATLLSEDGRFYLHPGLDPVAVLRSLYLNARSGRVVAGGSTLTQQLVRNLVPLSDRSWSNKLREAFYALRLEAALSKREILELYLNRVPYGNQALGIEAASQLYFDRPARALSPAQAAFLAVLPRAPGLYNPYTGLDEILPLQRQLLNRMGEKALLTEEQLRLALAEPILPEPPRGAFEAPHFCDLLQQRGVQGATVRTTLDLSLQREVEGLLRAHLGRLEEHRVTNGAVLVLDVETGEVLAMAG
ncbi:MAG: transglycosylase domain-containing protein, partial [Candidatus Eremiobacterota bacterium]